MIFDKMRLDGKVAIVTGSGRGLGRAMALALAEAGADVVVTARSESEIEDTTARIQELGRKSASVVCDIGNRASVNHLFDKAVKAFGTVDILINNAGVSIIKPLLEFSEEDWQTTLNINLTGMFYCCQAAGPIMIRQGKGKIINVTSVNGLRSKASMIPYATSKGGIIAFTRTLAIEWAPHHINVNAIGPGAFYTKPMQVVLDDPRLGAIRRKKIPMKREGRPEEIGPLAVYLASEASDFMTGEIIYIDGGELAKL
ncbi:MAG: SDR family oxidoreductase [Deltaproteobacteria bacterium]|nr:SDR family oxidoreductase [Deltaproteobacteria bacterium]